MGLASVPSPSSANSSKNEASAYLTSFCSNGALVAGMKTSLSFQYP
ncbi:hypothetical protein COLO4_20285 [Corchorus olitorius]|uniref:Uncharacterized protein n=1 Tax=Corchorus olitorius TaxID=93759 RepID=A0A1R3J0J3_9ROSI|nr:hypothetical protein COLO4_20285 [Corchorus olitorius]